MLDLSHTHPLTQLQQEAPAMLDRFKTDKTPIVITVDGKATAVLQDAESYQQLLDRIELLETLAGIRNSLAEFEQGKGIPLVHEVSVEQNRAFEQFRQKYDLPN